MHAAYPPTGQGEKTCTGGRGKANAKADGVKTRGQSG